MIRMVNVNCIRCGTSIDIDASNLQAFCPNCGEKLVITVSQVMDILDEKKEIKRKGIVYEKDVNVRKTEKKAKPKRDYGWIFITITIMAVW